MSTDPHEAFRAAGISPVEGPPRPHVRADCAGLARRVRERDVRTLGLAPAGDGVAVPAVAIELGRALAERSVGLVAVLDGDGTWPCAPALADPAAAEEGRLAATSWLADNLVVLTPYRSSGGSALTTLEGVLAQEGAAFHHVVVDLTGFEHVGEHVGAFALLDAVALVARSGRTTGRELRRLRRELPDGRDLGVLLTGV